LQAAGAKLVGLFLRDIKIKGLKPQGAQRKAI